MAFRALVRCEINGKFIFGDLLESNKNGYTVKKLDGDVFGGFKATEEAHNVQRVRHLTTGK